MITRIFTQGQTDKKVDECAFEPFCGNLAWNAIVSRLGISNSFMGMSVVSSYMFTTASCFVRDCISKLVSTTQEAEIKLSDVLYPSTQLS